MCCDPAKGWVEFVDGWLIKSSFITKDEISLSANQDQNPNKQKKSIAMLSLLGLLVTIITQGSKYFT
jgi:hypothetical protein